MILNRAWIVECSRCANDGQSYEATGEEAAADLRSRGWTDDDGSATCQQCNNEAAARAPFRKASR